LILNYTSESSTALAADLAKKLESEHKIRTACLLVEQGTPTGGKTLIQKSREAFPATEGKDLQVDIIVNNAGVARNAMLPDVTVEDFEFTYRVNVLGPLLLVQAAQPYLPKDRSGRIINISSISSSTGFVTQSVYGGTKAALEAMTRTWARELAENCTVNAINPGPVEGPMYATNKPEFLKNIEGWIMHTPHMAAREGIDRPDVIKDALVPGARLAYVSEIAGIVGMLTTPDAAWCTGQVVGANGGLLFLH
jgi:3-oxoacyl-[acyl-carrier protein] reductase